MKNYADRPSASVANTLLDLHNSSLDHKLYTSDYDSDSDSVASENQPLAVALPHRDSPFALIPG